MALTTTAQSASSMMQFSEEIIKQVSIIIIFTYKIFL